MDFRIDQYSNLYRMFSLFRTSYFGTGNSNVSTAQFKTMCSLVVLDATRMPTDLKSAPIDVRLELAFKENIAVNTYAHVLLIYDKVVSYSLFSELVLSQVWAEIHVEENIYLGF